MYYLIDTNRNNGCLRAIPGSHRKRHRLHDLLPQRAEEIRDVDESHPALQLDPDEVDVPVKAGDLVASFVCGYKAGGSDFVFKDVDPAGVYVQAA